jgi:hypothetical protein
MSISTLMLILLLTFGVAAVVNRWDLRRARQNRERGSP